MAQTKEGGKTMRATMLKKLGSEEALREYYQHIGRIGGRNSTTGGFASDVIGKDGLSGRERAKIVGAKGGRISRRTKKNLDEIEKAEQILEEDERRWKK